MSARGRRRRRLVAADLGAMRARLRAAGEADHAAWKQIRTMLLDAVGESTFEIWLAPLELIAVDLQDTLVVFARPETGSAGSLAASAAFSTAPPGGPAAECGSLTSRSARRPRH